MNIVGQVLDVIAGKAVVEKNEICVEDKLLNLGIDSLKKVELIIAIENDFGIHFLESDLNPNYLITVEDIIRLVEKTIKA